MRAKAVSVEDAASAIETESSKRVQVITNIAAVNLPLNGRGCADLASGVRSNETSFPCPNATGRQPRLWHKHHLDESAAVGYPESYSG